MTRVLDLPIEHLATTLAPLRGPRTDPTSPLAPLPVRVAASEDGTYEVLDGFKRVARWIADGYTHVPAIVEARRPASCARRACSRPMPRAAR